MNMKRFLRVRWNNFDIKLNKSKRNRSINNKDFTIISNNCWASYVYKAHNKTYQTPTIGLYFNIDDYLLFLSDLKNNLETPIKFINPKDSKRYDVLKNKENYGSHPVGVINGIEIYFLHYKSEKEALEKWNRRVERVNYDNLIIKLSAQSNFTEKHALQFDQLPFKNKILFTNKEITGVNSAVVVREAKNLKEVPVYLEPYARNKNIDITKMIIDL